MAPYKTHILFGSLISFFLYLINNYSNFLQITLRLRFCVFLFLFQRQIWLLVCETERDVFLSVKTWRWWVQFIEYILILSIASISAGPRPRQLRPKPKPRPQKIFILYNKGLYPIGLKFYKRFEFFLNSCALLIISNFRDIINFIINL